ncbi:MAG TPA: FAD-binding oxidoreductase [Planctomycetaceae bacterium]|nr:FAD-binding oxidoreductase [Planctomycetaceae bacterium]
MTTPRVADDFVPATASELQRFLAENAAGAKERLCPVGGRTALHYGVGHPVTRRIDLRDLSKVIDYPARDMTVTVEAGIRVAALQKLLATERQQLPIDIAQAERATIGGALTTNTNGPRRFGAGTFRDYVIGITAMTAAGQVFHGGGRVVKNVAGYDLCKLLVGSRGSLAVVTQVTLKLRPRPETIAWWWISFEMFAEVENVLERLLTSAARPSAVELLNPSAAKLVSTAARLTLPTNGPVLAIAVEGTPREVEWQLEVLRKEVVAFGVQSLEQLRDADAAALLETLTEFPVCADDPLTFQANLRPSRCVAFAEEAARLGVAVQCHAGNGLVIGQLPEETATAEHAARLLDPLRQRARDADGNLLILHCDEEWKAALPMGGDPEPAWPLMDRVKRQLDPHGLLNPSPFAAHD